MSNYFYYRIHADYAIKGVDVFYIHYPYIVTHDIMLLRGEQFTLTHPVIH